MTSCPPSAARCSTTGFPLRARPAVHPRAAPCGRAHARTRCAALERPGCSARACSGRVRRRAGAGRAAALRAAALALVDPHRTVVTDWSACWFWTGVDAPGDHLSDAAAVGLPPAPARAAAQRAHRAAAPDGCRPSDVTCARRLRGHHPAAHRLGPRAGSPTATAPSAAWTRWPLLGDFDARRAARAACRGSGACAAWSSCARWPRWWTPRSESPGESTLRLRWLDLPTLPRPTPQVPVTVGDVEVYRIDLGVPELRYGCEYDGEEFHGRTPERRRGPTADLRARFGWDGGRSGQATTCSGRRGTSRRVLIQGIRRRPSTPWRSTPQAETPGLGAQERDASARVGGRRTATPRRGQRRPRRARR